MNISFERNINKRYVKEIRKLKSLVLNNLSEVVLNYIQHNKSKHVTTILKYVPRKAVQKILFDNFSTKQFKPFGYYSHEFLKMTPFVTKVISLVGWVITKNNFQNLIISSYNLEELRFSQWKIDSQKWWLKSLSKTKLKVLSFIECGRPKHSNWKEYPDRLQAIFLAVSECSLINTVQKIELLDNWVSLEKVKEMLKPSLTPQTWSLKGIRFELLDDQIDSYGEFVA